MKVAIITDQHFGARKNSKQFHDYFLKFYNDVFFPTLEKHKIKTVVDMGDTFDSRKGIDFAALAGQKTITMIDFKRWESLFIQLWVTILHTTRIQMS